ncbi:MAG: EthD family reductase [Alphaproteobacteria bacterium]|nr:EthD family reductase [Alphaproteobacteria bacterium]
MIRLMSFLKRRADLDRPAFFRWWLGDHRKLVVKIPNIRRYTISHATDTEDGPFDGLAELWFESAEAARAAFATPAGQAGRADAEAHVSRMERLPVVEYPCLDKGTSPRFKLVAALKRRADMDRPAFKSWWLERHAPMVLPFPSLARYQVNLVEEGEETFADGVAEVCFDDLATLMRVMTSAPVRAVQEDSHAHTVARYRLYAEEHRII